MDLFDSGIFFIRRAETRIGLSGQAIDQIMRTDFLCRRGFTTARRA